MNDLRHIRVYVSSYYGDMQAERDHLLTVVLPRLRAQSIERGVTIEIVDLRSSMFDDADGEAYILNNFLDEIQKCKPYFIGILGENYGWIPPAIPEDLLRREPWLREQTKEPRSVTELEFLYGALRTTPKTVGTAFFYFRDPAYVFALPAAERTRFLSADPADNLKLQLLKSAVRGSGLPVRENFADAQSLGELVFADLTRVVDNLLSTGPRTTLLTPGALDDLMQKAVAPDVVPVAAPVSVSTPIADAAPVATPVQTEPQAVQQVPAVAVPAPSAPAPVPPAPAPPSADVPHIVLKHMTGSKANTTQEFTVGPAQEILVGRDVSSTVRYAESDTSVSRDHIRILQNFGDPYAYLIIAKGRNGTFINNAEVSGTSALRDGDLVQVGRGGPVFRFEQFPKPQNRPVKPTDPSVIGDAPLPPDPNMADAVEDIGKQTTELKFDPAFAMQEAKRKLAEAQPVPNQPMLLDKTDDPEISFRPMASDKKSEEKDWTTVIGIVIIVVIVIAFFILFRH